MKLIFVHGGPGLNSGPEENLLTQCFDQDDEIIFWNEPSASTFHSACESLSTLIESMGEAKATIIAHSFGAVLVNEILPKVEDRIARLILIAPVSNLAALDKNIISAVSEKVEELRTYLDRFDDGVSFSEERFTYLFKAACVPELGLKYWHKKDLAAGYQTFSRFSLENFKSIRSTCGLVNLRHKTRVPTDVIYGLHDQIVPSEERTEVERLYENSKIHIFQNSAHYGHIEEQDLFTKVLSSIETPSQVQESSAHENA